MVWVPQSATLLFNDLIRKSLESQMHRSQISKIISATEIMCLAGLSHSITQKVMNEFSWNFSKGKPCNEKQLDFVGHLIMIEGICFHFCQH